jgi:hypothetical protein
VLLRLLGAELNIYPRPLHGRRPMPLQLIQLGALSAAMLLPKMAPRRPARDASAIRCSFICILALKPSTIC